MPKGVYPRKRQKQASVALARPRYRQETTNAGRISVEPTVPTVHIERGSGGEYRYGVRAYGLTTAQAREEALREFEALEIAVHELKATILGLAGNSRGA